MKYWIYSILLGAVSFSLQAQNRSFKAEADTNTILIGEQFRVTLTATLPRSSAYVWPVLPDSTDGLELVSASLIDSLSAGEWILTQTLTLTSFDSGYFAVPPLTLQAGEQVLSTEAIAIAVRFPEVSEEQGYYDIKKPMEVPLNWWRILLWVAVACVLIGLIVWAVITFRERGKKEKVSPELLIPPYEYAMQQLARLEEDQVWQKGALKTYYSRLIDILRIYLERQMGLTAMESTAEEIIEDLEKQTLPRPLLERLKETLRLSAMVKFAKEKPGPVENEAALVTVREFVVETRPLPSKKEEEHAH